MGKRGLQSATRYVILSTGPSVVNEWELEVVTTVVLGGVTITGETGNSFGVIVGIFLLGMLK